MALPTADPSVLNAFINARMEVDFVLMNGSTRVLYKLDDSNRPRSPDVAAIVFLCLLLAASLVTNLSVLATISISAHLRQSAVYNLLAHLSGTCLLDVVTNLSVSICYASLVHWTMPGALCSANSFLMLFVSAATCNAVVCLVIERFCLVRNPVRHIDRMKTVIYCCRIGIMCSWIMLGALYAPTAIRYIVDAVAFPSRYSCGPNGNYHRVYMVILLVLSHIVPLAVILACLVTMAWIYLAQKRAEAQLRKAGIDRDSPLMNAVALISEESRNTLLVLVLTAAYVVLLLPHVLSVHQFQVSHSRVPTNTTAFDDFIAKLLEGRTPEQAQAVSLYRNEIKEMYNQTHRGVVDIVPLVKEVEEGTFQTAFIWSRYIFDTLVPILIFCLQADVRAKASSFFRHFIVDRIVLAVDNCKQPPRRPKVADGSTSSLPHHQQPITDLTPVLFITDYGLVLRTLKKMATPLTASEFDYVQCDIVPPAQDVPQTMKPQSLERHFETMDMISLTDDDDEEQFNGPVAPPAAPAFIPAEKAIPVKGSPPALDRKTSKIPRLLSFGAARPVTPKLQQMANKKRCVRFNSVVKEIPVPNRHLLDNTYLVDQLKSYFASQGTVLLCEKLASPPLHRSNVPWSAGRLFVRERAVLRDARKRMANIKRPGVYKISRKLAPTNRIARQPWRI